MKNNKTRRILFTLAFVSILVGICVVCFIVGRGHTVYLDNKTTDDEKYHYYDAIDIYQDGEKLTTLNPRERTSITQIGQNCEIELRYRKGKNDEKKDMVAYFKLPYNLDGIIINLPAIRMSLLKISSLSCSTLPITHETASLPIFTKGKSTVLSCGYKSVDTS